MCVYVCVLRVARCEGVPLLFLDLFEHLRLRVGQPCSLEEIQPESGSEFHLNKRAILQKKVFQADRERE